jgi:hypothetical protein
VHIELTKSFLELLDQSYRFIAVALSAWAYHVSSQSAEGVCKDTSGMPVFGRKGTIKTFVTQVTTDSYTPHIYSSQHYQ